MRNDPPTNLRMGFGYRQARRAGLGGVRASRSPNQYNKAVDENEALRRLRRERELDSGWIPFIVHWIDEGISPERILELLSSAQHHAWYRSKRPNSTYRPEYLRYF
jgi:hypothetical protein